MADPPPPRAAVRPGGGLARRRPGLTGTDGLLVLMTAIWGVNYIVIKAALKVFSPLAFNAARFLLAAPAVGLVAWAWHTRRPSRRALVQLAGLGLLGHTIYQLSYIEGMARARAGSAALIMAAVPVLTAAASHGLGHERLRRQDVAGLALSTVSLAILVVGGDAGARGGAVAGNLLILLAAVLWTAYTLWAKSLVDTLGPVATTAWSMGLGAVPLLAICAPAALAQPWAAVTPAAWGAVLFSSLLSLALAYLIWYRGVERLGATRTAFYSNFSPAITLLAAWPLLGEVPTVWQLAGAAGVFGSLAVVRS